MLVSKQLPRGQWRFWQPTAFCKWCKGQVVPGWEHLAWECAAHATDRPEAPTDYTQRRIGWPRPGRHSRAER
eukprot:7874913-Alexandrium_andersonii.AAC.1